MRNIKGSIEVSKFDLEKRGNEGRIKGCIEFEYDPDGKSDDIMQSITKVVYEGLDLLHEADTQKEQKAFLCYLEAVRSVMRDATDKLDEIMDDSDLDDLEDLDGPDYIKGNDELEELLRELDAEIKAQEDEAKYMLDDFDLD